MGRDTRWTAQSIATVVAETDLNLRIRFTECEKWRKEFGTDDLPNTFEYPEREKVFQYYPQYYHKTDKVSRVVFREELRMEC